MEKRTKEIKVRLTETEYQKLQERKTKARLAEWLRELALDQQPKKQYTPIDPALLYELNRIGNNLNQVTRYLNSHKGKPLELVKIASALRAIEQELQEVRNDR